MATNLQDIIAKRVELQKTNPNATNVDARNALTPVTTTPVTPPTVPTPVQTQTAVNDLGGDAQNRENTRNVMNDKGSTLTPNGAKIDANGVVTPVSVETIPPTVTPTVTAEIKPPEPVKTEVASTVTPTTTTTPPVDYNTSTGRESDIQKNITDITKANPTLLKDRNAYNQAFGYATADQGKKAMLDASFSGGNTPTDSGTIFNTLKMGGSVPATNTPEYRQAQARYNTFKKFSTYDVASLSTAIQGGDLLMGTQAYTDLISDPTMLAKVQRAKAFTNGVVDLTVIGEKQGAYVMSQNPSVAQALADGNMTQDEYNQLTNNAEVQTQAKVVSDKKAEYDKYKRQLDNISNEVDAEYAGKETTDTFKSAIKSNRDKLIRQLFNSASDEYQNATGLYTELKNSSTAVLAINMDNYKTEQAKQAQIATEQRALQGQKDMVQYKSDFEKKQAQEALNDPQTQIQSTLDEFSKLGVTATESVASKVAKANEFINSGKGTLSDYVNTLRSDLMAKPEYKQALLKKANEGVSFQTIGDKVYKVKDGQLIDTGVSTAKAEKGTFVKGEDGNWINTTTKEIINEKDLISQQEATKLNNYIASTPVGSKGGQCGAYANKNPVAVANGFHFGDSYQSKLDQTNSKEGTIGAFAVWNPGGVTKDNGHVGQIVGESQDGNSWIIRDSNFSNNPKDETVREHVVSKSVISSTGGAYAVPRLNKKGANEGIVTTILGSGKFTKDQATAIKNAISNGEDPLTVVKNQARGIMQGPVATEVEKLEQTKANMESLDSALKEFYKLGGDSSYLKGNYEKVINSFGKLTDPKLVSVGVKIQKALQKYRNAVSGTAYGIQEGKDIASVFPGIDKGEVLNNTITQANLESMQSDIDSAYRGVIGSAYDTLKAQQKTNTPNKKDDFLSALKSIATSFQNSISGVKK